MNMRRAPFLWVVIFLAVLSGAGRCGAVELSFRIAITSPLEFPRTPMDPEIDFAERIRAACADGRLDPDSIEVVNVATGESVPRAVTEDFAYGDRGRVEWVITNPAHTEYEVRFRTTDVRRWPAPAGRTPRIGVGDLLRYNAGRPRPIALPAPSALVDLTGDGLPDLVGCWNYAHRYGSPWDGVVCYPRVGAEDRFLFGDLVRARYLAEPRSDDFRHFTGVYMEAAFGDLDGDGHVDMVFSPRAGDSLHLYRNTGRRDAGGMPVFEPSGAIARPAGAWSPCRVVDLDGDGAMDFVVCAVPGEASTDPPRAYYIRNLNPRGWPVEPAEPVELDVGAGPCFLDLDGDGALDAICLAETEAGGVHERRLTWHRNRGGVPPAFDGARALEDIAPHYPTAIAAVREGPRQGLLVQHDVYQAVSLYELATPDAERPVFRHWARAESESAVMSLSDQAWPHVCDWDGDGALDILVGGGYGWPRIVRNLGTNDAPEYDEPRPIPANGAPIKILRNDVLGEPAHWHNMGYSYPAYVDWDGDGLPDLMLPNETNRIFWYRNEGTRREPEFGDRRQLLVDGYPDSPELRRRSAERAVDAVYPLEVEQPFFWRTGAAFADWNGDGLMDLATHDGATRKLTLFAQYRADDGALRLRKERPLTLTDGRLIDDAIVERAAHWTESFRAVDWDGDGLLDLVYSCAGTAAEKGSMYLLRNAGSATDPVFEAPRTLRCFGTPIKVTNHGPHPWAGDLDGDGLPDLLTCVEWSVYPFFTHAALEMESRPAFEIGPVQRR